MTEGRDNVEPGETDIAIVGMAAQVPGAATLAGFWRNLRDGVSAIRRFGPEELEAAGEAPGLLRHRDYVPFGAPLDGFDMFDAEFFGLSPKDAAVMDPQHRKFLEVVWEALENAGHPPDRFAGAIGVFAGCGESRYYHDNVLSHPDLVAQTGTFLLRHTGNDKDFMATRASHVFDLRGPSLNLQTACSTSLVAVHYAIQSLLNGECDLALAGGVTIELPQTRGYLWRENEILSPDGACRAFDHRAGGTVFGSGAGCVVLRRAADARAAGDHVWALIRGSAVNNDGAAKAGYLAPSVEGQAAAVAEAHAVAGVAPDTIGYVECHGTGTRLGDPIEVAALARAFGPQASGASCRIGSVKSNIGHLDTAAGVAGLIKAALALHHRRIPASLGYEAPNPAIDFAATPFRVNDRLSDWPEGPAPRRAGVNALGVGGTNAHVVLEEAPPRPAPEAPAFPFQILALSGHSRAALDANAARLAAHLRAHPEQPLADVAWTLKEGRRAFARRRVLVAASHEEAAALLEAPDARRVHDHQALDAPDIAFLFPGGGAQYPGMARDLAETEPVFAEVLERGLAHLETLTGEDPRAVLFAAEGSAEAARLRRPSVQLPLILIVEYALSELWQSWGVQPAALAGHSMGENTAACVAGVMGFEECIGLVHLRGRLFDRVAPGGMLSVALAAGDLAPLLGPDLDLAAENAPDLSVVSGPEAALERLAARLRARGVECRPVAIDVAAHSRMLEPILDEFRAHLATIDLQPPRLPLTSNRTGTWMTAEQATSPDYWVEHLRHTVRFSDCLGTLAAENRVYLEVGPGHALSALARQHGGIAGNRVLASLRHPDDAVPDDRHFLECLGRLWALGAAVDWDQVWGEGRRQRVVLPGYAFQRARYFLEPQAAAAPEAEEFLTRSDDIAEWGWVPVWRPRAAPVALALEDGLAEAAPLTWLFFSDAEGLADAAARRLRAAGHRVIEVRPGDLFARVSDDAYRLAPERGREGYDLLLRDLVARGLAPDRIGHFWLVTGDAGHRPGSSFYHRVQEQGFYALLFLAQAIEEAGLPRPLHLTVVSNGAARVRDEALPWPEKATLAGPARVIPRELEGVTVASLDVALPEGAPPPPWQRAARRARAEARAALEAALLEELLAEPGNRIAAFRGRRYEQDMARRRLPPAALPEGGVVLITGGFGGIGLSLARDLAAAGAKIALMGRGALPPRAEWDGYLLRHAPQDRVARRLRAVLALEAAGADVLPLAGDVCNEDELRAAVAAAEAAFGPVTGVIHAAGVIDDGPILARGPAAIEDVFTPKILGLQALDRVFPDGRLDWLALCSSSSTVTAPAGQVDYVAANEVLNAHARARAGGRTRVVAIDWGIWAEVGMAAEAVARRAGHHAEAPVTRPDLPLLDRASFDAAGRRVFTTRLASTDWLVDEHRLRAGGAVLPGSASLSFAAHALAAQGETGSVEIRDLTFLRPVAVPEGGAREITLRLTRDPVGYRFEMLADADAGGRAGRVLCAEAMLALRPLPAPPRLDLKALRGRLPAPLEAAAGGKLAAAQAAQLEFGPRWQVLDTMALGRGEGLADLSLPEAAAGDAGHLLHPALLDIATGWAMALLPSHDPGDLWVPVGYARLRLHTALPARIASHVRLGAGSAAGDAVFDVTLAAPDGSVLVEIEGFRMQRLAEAAALTRLPRLTPAEIETDAPAAAAPLSPGEDRLAHNLAQGIRPAEGGEAFARALALGLPQVVVSSLDLDALCAQAARPARRAAAAARFERPDLQGDYVAPESQIERVLAGFWQELLGVSRVGVEDSFFDLGGHSLIAVRLFAMIKRSFQVDFPISVLFEAPTIRACAALIAERTGADPEAGPAAPARTRPARTRPESRFTHLVAMYEGEGGTCRPFFLVAGMFGNVLNLRHLAHLLGAGRPFYGLQARGLFGDERPHDSIPEAARDCIAEMKQVQPEGPYLVGGFSGGGITAYEIVRQLEEMGDRVALLVMLDTPLPRRDKLRRRDRLLIQLQELRRKGPLYPLLWARNRVAWEIARRRAPETTEAPAVFHNAEIEAAFLAAVARYEVRPWSGPLALFRPPQRGHWTVSGGRRVDIQRAYLLGDNGWGRAVADIAVHEVPGDHDSMVLEPNVRVLAQKLRREIESAEARATECGTVLSFRDRTAAE
ncbi:type I polyketide synthase [Roseivivax sp. CAU 1761]